MSVDPIKLLKIHELKNTKQRVRVLEEIALANVAISQPELEKKLGKEIDRVTLYRILNIYEDKGILHRIMDRNGTANYAICSSLCTANHHHDEHVHFNCTNCHKIYCLDVVVPAIEMPLGYSVSAMTTTAYGVCKNCAQLS